jgi:uncharacterized membrane protein YkoI
MKAYLLLFLGYLLLSPLHSAMAAGQENPRQNSFIRNAQEQEQPQTRISRREASDIARASYGGKVIRLDLDRSVWRVRMDIGGTVTDVLVDAETGAVSRPSE